MPHAFKEMIHKKAGRRRSILKQQREWNGTPKTAAVDVLLQKEVETYVWVGVFNVVLNDLFSTNLLSYAFSAGRSQAIKY